MRWSGALVMGLVALAAGPAWAQESGWHYSPLPGEGDRATLGCSYGANTTRYTCMAVRCEDDSSIGVHIHTSRPDGDVGKWTLEFDDHSVEVTAAADGPPYHARVDGDVTDVLAGLKNSALVYLEPASGPATDRAISLSGSLYAINKALYFCAPKGSGDEVPAVDGQDGAGDVAGEGAAQK